MKLTRCTLLCTAALALAIAQSASGPLISNLATAKWDHDKDGDSVVLHADEKTGALDLLVRFPAGHVIAPHSHDSNERIIVVEGDLVLREDTGEKVIHAGGYAWLPAKQVQRLSCSSAGRCTFYLSWDGSPKSHPAQ